MDYRVRWQQRRRQRAQQRLLAIPAALVLALLIYGLMRLFAGGGHIYWMYEEPGQTVPRFAVGPAAVHIAWSDGHMVTLQARNGIGITAGPFFSKPEAFNVPPLLANHALYQGSDLGMMRAIEARTGQLLWEFDSGAPIRSRPVEEGDRIYFGNDAGKVYAFALGGTKIWGRELGAAVSGEGAIIGDRVFFATTGGSVYALKRSDGATIWKRDVGAPVFSPVTAADPLVMVGSDTGSLFVLSAADGKPVTGAYRTAGLVREGVAVTEETLCFGSTDGWVRAISRDGKRPLWAQYLGGPVTAGPGAYNGLIYAASPNRLYALQADNGRTRRMWKGEEFAGEVVATRDTVYVGTTTGRVLALVAP
ncbi:MAG: PQQ-binding-like beta-propeller repeat protein [Armatimonadia bacterium]